MSTLALAGLASVYIASRIAHSAGMLLAERFIVFRALGSAGSLLVLLVGGGMLARRLIEFL